MAEREITNNTEQPNLGGLIGAIIGGYTLGSMTAKEGQNISLPGAIIGGLVGYSHWNTLWTIVIVWQGAINWNYRINTETSTA